jgi:sugar phosphate isomerase/epimerase
VDSTVTRNIGLATSGSPYSFGLHPDAGRARITVREFIDFTAGLGLTGVEFPERMLEGEDIPGLRTYAEDKGMPVTLDTGGFDPAKLSGIIEQAHQIGARTVRTVIGGAKIGGDRRPLAGRWQPFMRDVLAKLKTATQTAERLKINLAVENHQDLASEELLWLCASIDSPYFGITLDTGNPLATAEEPIEYFRRVAPYVKNAHLKDYWIWHFEEGYRLVRCPLGQGYVDFPKLLEILPDTVTLSVELGALQARNIRVLAADFWPDYPPRTAADLAAALRTVSDNAKADGDWQTPAERNESPEAIAKYEQEQLEESVAYVGTLA